jgi:hypothetical protein
MKTFKVACSGWLEVEVQAETEEQAIELVYDERPGAAGDLYDIEITVIELENGHVIIGEF